MTTIVTLGLQVDSLEISGIAGLVQRLIAYLEENPNTHVVNIIKTQPAQSILYADDWVDCNEGDVITRVDQDFFCKGRLVTPRLKVPDDCVFPLTLTKAKYVRGTKGHALLVPQGQVVESEHDAMPLLNPVVWKVGLPMSEIVGIQKDFKGDIQRYVALRKDMMVVWGEDVPFPTKICKVDAEYLSLHSLELGIRYRPEVAAFQQPMFSKELLMSDSIGDMVQWPCVDPIDMTRILKYQLPKRQSFLYGDRPSAPDWTNPMCKDGPPGRGLFSYYGPNHLTVWYSTTHDSYHWFVRRDGMPLCSPTPDAYPALRLPRSEIVMHSYVPTPWETQNAWLEVTILHSENTYIGNPGTGWLIEALKRVPHN